MNSNRGANGKAILLGAGPGDPELITVKGIKALSQADVIVYDYLASQELLMHAPEYAEKIYVGKKAGSHTMKQSEINELLVRKTLEGKLVVRLKGGDPFVFGRGGEECQALAQAGCEFEIIPGITSGIAAATYAGIPVTHRTMASSVALITGHEDPLKAQSSFDWQYLSRGVDTLVFFMGVGNLESIAKKLIKNGRPGSTPVAVIRWGTTSEQQTVTATLDTIASEAVAAGITPPAVIVIGDVVKLRSQIAWFEKKPLFGRTIINTRSREQASVLTSKLKELGANVIELPTIRIVPYGAGSELECAIEMIAAFDWLIFTSPNGVRSFFDLLIQQYKDIRHIGGVKIACIGPATADALKKYSIAATVVAKEAVAEGLINELERACEGWNGKRVMIPRAEVARDVLPLTLKNWGAEVTVVPAYRTVPPEKHDKAILDRIRDDNYDLVTFSSSSTFRNFLDLFGSSEHQILKTLRGASIGPVTSTTMKEFGVCPVLEATEHTIKGLVSAMKEYFRI
ncbi:uroporphyrinogen-III C-methyltransferase [Chitinispirillales bacterium ANBcel5]|uniref:uroporphyrinogen-III C-methyltransferase n=1 Tax=Cellulosispirillum alkaliphilum TaxID=3039283 RepID=UPI002A538E65|nr:uroporphyrinogen-III C-methyltransferase [Chitinispirillales bacterium ANBcel5]